jgi:hypothetical protein
VNNLLRDWRVLTGEYRRSFLALVGTLFLVMALDFTLRVLVLRDAGLRDFSAPSSSSIAAPESEESIFKRLEAWVPAKVTVVTPKERDIRLQGMFGSGAEARAALLLVAPDGASERVRASLGQVVEGWTVEKIELGRVVLKRGEESRELLLFRPRPE